MSKDANYISITADEREKSSIIILSILSFTLINFYKKKDHYLQLWNLYTYKLNDQLISVTHLVIIITKKAI